MQQQQQQQQRVRRKPVGSSTAQPKPTTSAPVTIPQEAVPSPGFQPTTQHASNFTEKTLSSAAFFSASDVETKITYFPPPPFRGSTRAASIPSQANVNVLNYVHQKRRDSLSPTLSSPPSLTRSLTDGSNASSVFSPHYQLNPFPPPMRMTRGYSDSFSPTSPQYYASPYQTSPTFSYQFPPSRASYAYENCSNQNNQPRSLFEVDKLGHESSSGRVRRSGRLSLAPMSTMVGDIKSSATRGLKTIPLSKVPLSKVPLSKVPLSKIKVPTQIKCSKNTKKLIWTGARWAIRITAMGLGSDFDIGDCDFGGGDIEIGSDDVGGEDVLVMEDGDGDVFVVEEDGAGDVFVAEDSNGDLFVVEEDNGGDLFVVEEGGDEAAFEYTEPVAGDQLGNSSFEGFDAGPGADAGIETGMEDANQDFQSDEQASPLPEDPVMPAPCDPMLAQQTTEAMAMNMSAMTWSPLQSCASMPAC